MGETRHTMVTKDRQFAIDAEPTSQGYTFLANYRRKDKRFARCTIAPTLRYNTKRLMREVYQWEPDEPFPNHHVSSYQNSDGATTLVLTPKS